MILLQTALSADSPFLLNMTVNPQFLAMLNQQKHKRTIIVQKQNKTLSAFFVKTNSKEEHLVILAELVSTYHGVIHHHSFVSQDCGNKLLENCVLTLQLLPRYHAAALRQPAM